MLNGEAMDLGLLYSGIKKSLGRRAGHIKVVGIRTHAKASEIYVDVHFSYPEEKEEWIGSVPIEYRRTGTLAETPEDAASILVGAYEAMNPSKRDEWINEQDKFWDTEKKRAKVTRGFYEGMKDSRWKCVNCQLPSNPNWARRVQDIKEFGYTLATDTAKFCHNCNDKTTHLVLLRLPRGAETGYETWSTQLRKRILKVLDYHDAYDNARRTSLLPDHKFPEIRWDEATGEENPDDMDDDSIREKFQLLTNQRNQQKREVCRTCFQTGRRGAPYGIKFYYEGNEMWAGNTPRRGKAAEQGCIGCGWYDLNRWREELNRFLKDKSQ
jgi:hypothetical protein